MDEAARSCAQAHMPSLASAHLYKQIYVAVQSSPLSINNAALFTSGALGDTPCAGTYRRPVGFRRLQPIDGAARSIDSRCKGEISCSCIADALVGGARTGRWSWAHSGNPVGLRPALAHIDDLDNGQPVCAWLADWHEVPSAAVAQPAILPLGHEVGEFVTVVLSTPPIPNERSHGRENPDQRQAHQCQASEEVILPPAPRTRLNDRMPAIGEPRPTHRARESPHGAHERNGRRPHGKINGPSDSVTWGCTVVGESPVLESISLRPR